MSNSTDVYNIAIFLLILNIVTPVFAFALTDFSLDQDYTDEVHYLSQDDLIASGVYLESDQRLVLVYTGVPDYVEFNLTDTDVRVRWYDPILAPRGRIEIYTPLIGSVGDSWLFAHLERTIISGNIYQEGLNPEYIYNATLIGGWSNNYNWTRATLTGLGVELFFTCEKYDNNITAGIEAGELNVTLGRPVNYVDYNPTKFIGWYWGQISGANYYGLPVFVSWVFRIQAILLMFSAIVIARDLIGFT